MMYRVITSFIDLQDGEHAYSIGDAFPREGHTVSEERIAELAGSKNKRKMPLIEPVEVAPVQPEKPEPKKESKSDRPRTAGNAKSKSGKKK